MSTQNTCPKKAEFIHCRISYATKKILKEKAKENNCKNLTEFLEKIADKTIVILDNNVQNLLNSIARGLCHNQA